MAIRLKRWTGDFGWSWLVVVALGTPSAVAEPPANLPKPLDEAAALMALPKGFQVSLFAGEPDVRQPIALTFDPKGRLWVVECFSYPEWEMAGKTGKDRVLIFEDADNDGQFDKRTVFWDQGTNLSGIEFGFGGVWLCSTPNLLFVPDRDGDDRPDGPPEVVLDGWDLQARHNVFNGLVWGPDGWLWGCNGILSNSRVGPPGTPDSSRVPINCGVWRYHPTRKAFEAVAHGTTNPWGLDFDDYGEAFLTNCVIPHLFHVIPGARMQRMFGEDFNPHSHDLLKTCADHVHWDSASEQWLDIRQTGVTPTTDKLGGGHAHSGAAVYLGGSWPDEFRNSVLMGNIHGNRLNLDSLQRSGSGYVAKHQADFLQANDPWFRSVAQKVGPDGALYVLDWSDTGECHESDADGAHRENGRIYRASYGDRRIEPFDLSKLDDLALVGLQSHRNDWQVRQARRLLQERADDGQDLGPAREALHAMLADAPTSPRRLRALWALQATGGVGTDLLVKLLASPDEHLRAWAVRFLLDDRSKPADEQALASLSEMARSDPSPKVRLALASALQRLPVDRRAAIAEGLMARGEDADDPNLPLMVWYGVEPVAPTDLGWASDWALSARLPTVRRSLARRVVAADEAAGLAALAERLGSDATQPAEGAGADVVIGIAEALQGRKAIPMPADWPKARARKIWASSGEAGRRADRLSLLFGDEATRDALRALVKDADAPVENRSDAIAALADARTPGLVPDILDALDDRAVRSPALKAVSAYDEPAVPEAVLKRYPEFSDDERAIAVQTLATRPDWAVALLNAVEGQVVPRRDVSVTVARQIQGHGLKATDEALARAWGTLRTATADQAARMAHFKALIAPGASKDAPDPSRGRLVFERTCLPCHKMYGEGGDVGPELTGSDRANLDYVLMNVLVPSSAVAAEYRLTNVATTDGRLVAGLLREQTPTALVLQSLNGKVVVPRDEVEEVRTTTQSMMPEGLLDAMTESETRDLIAYLATPAQVPRPSGNAASETK